MTVKKEAIREEVKKEKDGLHASSFQVKVDKDLNAQAGIVMSEKMDIATLDALNSLESLQEMLITIESVLVNEIDPEKNLKIIVPGKIPDGFIPLQEIIDSCTTQQVSEHNL